MRDRQASELQLVAAIHVHVCGSRSLTRLPDAAFSLSHCTRAANKLKFFYKTVEWLPGQIELQIADDLFEHIAISSDLLLGQTGPKVMWAEVRELMVIDEKKRAAEAAGVDADGVPVITDLPATRYAPAAFTVDKAQRDAVVAAAGTTAPMAAPPLAPPSPPPPPPPSSPPPAASGALRVADVVEYRQWKGTPQWLVRWQGCGPDEDSWERRQVVEAAGPEIVAKADALVQ